ncbi:MAG: prepilin-type N-terminal cleavage/methylation domain-containing protein [Rubritalea sp.]|uniref:prepilin-type N-terminal cleavage/methylation domain-containing protein n=1 Tax=Rubritalea sp. TaxID=2109375 RepID=UPI00324208AF
MKTHRSLRKGFTLIELLTAVAITTVIIAVLIGTTRMSMDAWKDSSDKARASRLAKESIEVMARDLEGIVIRSGNDYEWLSIRMDDNEANGPTNAEIKNPLEFFFFSAPTDRYDGNIGTADDEGGDISAVIYKLAYVDQLDPVGKTFPVFSLYRQLINPDETFSKYLGKNNIVTGLLDSEDVTGSSNFIAENIYNFTVTLIFEFNNVTTGKMEQKRVPVMTSGTDFQEIRITGRMVGKDNPSTTSVPASQSPADIEDSSGNNVAASARLAGAELGILVLSDSAMRALNKKPFTDQAAFGNFVKENSHYFSKSVILPRP